MQIVSSKTVAHSNILVKKEENLQNKRGHCLESNGAPWNFIADTIALTIAVIIVCIPIVIVVSIVVVIIVFLVLPLFQKAILREKMQPYLIHG